jgi:hypothetical protein
VRIFSENKSIKSNDSLFTSVKGTSCWRGRPHPLATSAFRGCRFSFKLELEYFIFRRQDLRRDDDVLNEDWIKYCMVCSHRLLLLVLVAIGVGRRISRLEEEEYVSIEVKLDDGLDGSRTTKRQGQARDPASIPYFGFKRSIADNRDPTSNCDIATPKWPNSREAHVGPLWRVLEPGFCGGEWAQ